MQDNESEAAPPHVLLLGEDHPMEQYGMIKKKGFMDSKDAVLWVSVNWGLTPYD